MVVFLVTTPKKINHMHFHSNASTNKKQRSRIRTSKSTYRELAQQFEISTATVHRWAHRDEPEDRSCARKNRGYILDEHEQAFLVGLRKQDLTLDQVMDQAKCVLPKASRATVHRTLRRHGLGKLASKQQQETGQSDVFKAYDPGFLHIDCFYLPKLEGTKRYCFVAIDRATRVAYLAVYEHKDAASATHFLEKCQSHFPFRLHTILTDNGREFTLSGFKNRYGTKVTTTHSFEGLCQSLGIEQRTTKPYTPKTNGLVERMNGLTKENTTKRHRYETTDQMMRDLAEWLIRYNFFRPHGRLGRKTPYEATVEWYGKRPDLFNQEPTQFRTRHSCSQCDET